MKNIDLQKELAEYPDDMDVTDFNFHSIFGIKSDKFYIIEDVTQQVIRILS